LEAVTPVLRERLVGEAGAPQRGEQEVARAVAREYPPRAVGPMRGGRQAQQKDARAGVAEPGHRATPVALGRERCAAPASDLLTPSDQPRTAPAADELGV